MIYILTKDAPAQAVEATVSSLNGNEYKEVEEFSQALKDSDGWNTFIEAGDKLYPHYFDVSRELLEAMPDTRLILPFSVRQSMEGKFLGFSNAFFWTPMYSNEGGEGLISGEKSIKAIGDMPFVINSFSFSGAMFHSDLKGIGFRQNKYSPHLEFVLNAAKKGYDIAVTPKAVVELMYRMDRSGDNSSYYAELTAYAKSLSLSYK